MNFKQSLKLRQMKASMPVKRGSGEDHFVLLIGEYTGIGATISEFDEYFRTQGYKIIYEKEIEATVLPEFDKELTLSEEVMGLIEKYSG